MTDMPAAGTDRIRVLIADDHALFRRGLIMVLEAEPDIEVVAEAQDGTEVIGKAEEFVPDVLLMDVRMPKLNGIEAARAIRESVQRHFPQANQLAAVDRDLCSSAFGNVRGWAPACGSEQVGDQYSHQSAHDRKTLDKR